MDSFTAFINEKSDLLTRMREKNPLFYIFTAGKLKSGSVPETLQNDFTLRAVYQKADELSKKLGRLNVKILANNWPAAIVLIRFEEYSKQKPEEVIRRILKEMQHYLYTTSLEFSKAYEIEQNFKEFVNSKEVEDYFVSIRK
jgi:PHD/YefM family antitoxin component YafN of YafNO toxin-antitoxin module